MRIMAIWERISDVLQREWVDKSRKGLVEGVQVDAQRRQVKVPCIVSSQNEVVPVVRMDRRPDWFRISIRVPNWKQIVAVADGKNLYPIEKDGYKLLFFRNATVVEFCRGLLSATYYAVRMEGSKFFLVESTRFELEIPRFIETKEGVRQFLVENHIPADLLDSALELIQNQKKDFSNPNWKEGLEKSKSRAEVVKKEERPTSKVPVAVVEEKNREEIPLDTDEEPERPRRSPKRQERREREDKPRRPRPQLNDDPGQVIRRARGLSSKDFFTD